VISLNTKIDNLSYVRAICCLQRAFPCIKPSPQSRKTGFIAVFFSAVDELLNRRGAQSLGQGIRMGCGGLGLNPDSAPCKHDALATTSLGSPWVLWATHLKCQIGWFPLPVCCTYTHPYQSLFSTFIPSHLKDFLFIKKLYEENHSQSTEMWMGLSSAFTVKFHFARSPGGRVWTGSLDH
jgi:hypothetical protein